MKILIVNKFLYPNGGSETYIFNLGKELERQGHEVQYFGMEHEGRIVGNHVNAYTEVMDFHGGSKLSKLTYPLKTINNKDAAKKIREVLDDFWPDVVHLNNFSYQLTPSIIEETVNWRNDTGHLCRIVFTAHDYNLICPNHQLHNPNTHENCEKCLGGHFINCSKGKCIHGSRAKSLIGSLEAEYWNKKGTYNYIDKIICPSEFLKQKFDTNPIFKPKTIAIHNFIDKVEWKDVEKKDYVLYFGRFSEEKGTRVLIDAARKLPDIPFIFAGKGPLEDEIKAVPNITDVGFKSGEELDTLVREARFSICPSTVYENCPFSVMESQQRGTPVVGSRMGGIPELITDNVDGNLVNAEDPNALANMIKALWNNPEKVAEYVNNCLKINRDDTSDYTKKIVKIYSGGYSPVG